MMGWLIFALCLLLFLLLPLKLYVRYQENVRAWLTFGPVKIDLLPGRKNAKSKKKSSKESSFESHEEVKKQNKTDKEKLFEIARLVLAFLDDFRTKLRVDDLRLNIVLADEDPCDLSIYYGLSWIALGNLQPQLERLLVIKKRNIEIQCDYTAEKTVVNASVDFSITVVWILSLGIYHGFKLIGKYMSIMKNSKDGAVS